MSSAKVFDPTKIPPGSVIVVMGKRGTGKSFATKDIIRHLGRRIPMGLVINDTEEGNRAYEGMVPDRYLVKGADIRAVEWLMDSQKAQQKKFEDWNARPYASRRFLVIDDCGFDGAFMRHRSMQKLFCNGRHFNITLLIILQDMKQLSPGQRSQVDFIVATAKPGQDRCMEMWKEFGGQFPEFKDFEKAFSSLTRGHSCMVIYTQGSKSRLMRYTAEAGDKVRIGDPKWWKVCQH
jgi:Poxvirus A32 protein